MNIISSFLTGFSSTAFLFVLSAIIVFGFKYLRLIIKSFAVRNNPPEPKPKRQYSKKPKKPKSPSDKRSIQIDPSQIDKIYVKKSS